MAVLGVVTLVLLVFTLLFYAYLANHSDHDVSFFMSAGLILLVMNLATNAGGAFGLAWLYLAASLLFLGLGFAVDRANAAAFYASVGPWFKETFSSGALFAQKALSFLVFPAGIALYFVKYGSDPALARTCGKCGAWGLLFWAVLLWAILGLVL